MSLQTRFQQLEPGAEIRLFELDGSDFGADVLYFHGHAIPHTPEEIAAAGANADQLPAKSIWWKGVEYAAWPVQLEGIEATSDGTAPRPTFSAGEYLDARNFPAGNPTADPTQEVVEVWYMDQKTSEDGEAVAWELASPGDLTGEAVGRQCTTFCHWAMTGGYRGPNCGYTGPYRDEDGKLTDDPARDVCDGTLGTGCVPRFGEGNELPHGGFPAVSLIARS